MSQIKSILLLALCAMLLIGEWLISIAPLSLTQDIFSYVFDLGLIPLLFLVFGFILWKYRKECRQEIS